MTSLAPRSLAAALLSAAALLAGAGGARANPLDVYGFNPRAIGMGGAQVAVADDFTAAYYNPAGLAWRQKVHFGVGFQSAANMMTIDRQRTDPGRESELPPNHHGLTIGAVFPLGARIDNRIALGIGLYVPTSNLFRLDSVDQQTPQFYQYQGLPSKLVIAPALGFRLHEKLRIGVGMLVLADLTGVGNFDVDLVNRRLVRRDLRVDLGPSASATAGLLVGPFAGFTFGFAFRGALGLNFRLPVNLELDGVGRLALDVKGLAAWTPNHFTFGAAYEVSKALRLAFDLVVSQWSQAPDPATRLDVTSSGDVLARLGLASALTLRSQEIPLGAVNTVSPHVGAEWTFHANWLARFGYYYKPTPIPKQDGFTNYLDNDVHGFSAGIAWTTPDILEIHRNPITLELSMQAMVLPNRAVEKRATNDPIGNLQSRGTALSIAASFRHDF